VERANSTRIENRMRTIEKRTMDELLESLVAEINKRGGYLSFEDLEEVIRSTGPVAMYSEDVRHVVTLGLKKGRLAYSGGSALITTIRPEPDTR
jgi:hypothetical protein